MMVSRAMRIWWVLVLTCIWLPGRVDAEDEKDPLFDDVKYASSGANQHPAALTLGDDNFVYICGSSRALREEDRLGEAVNEGAALGVEDIFIAKVSRDGKLEWIRLMGSPQREFCGGLTTFGSEVYVIGTTDGTVERHDPSEELSSDKKASDVLFARLNSENGNSRWIHQHARDTEDEGWDIHVSKDGEHLYLFGATTGALSSEPKESDKKLFVGLLGVDGKHGSLKTREYSMENHEDITRVTVTVSEDGNSAFAASTYYSNDRFVFSLKQINLPDLSQGFEYKYDGQASVRPMTIAPDGDAGLVMSGIFYDTPEVGNQFYVAKFSANGAMKWCASDGVDGHDDNIAGAYATGGMHVVAVGDSEGNYGRTNMRGDRGPVAMVLNGEGEITTKYQMDVKPKAWLEVHASKYCSRENKIFMALSSGSAAHTGDLSLATFNVPPSARAGAGFSGLLYAVSKLPNFILISAIVGACLVLLCFSILCFRITMRRRSPPNGFEDLVYEEDYEMEGDGGSSAARVKSAGGVVRIPRGYVEPTENSN